MSRLIDADALNEHKFVGNKFVQIGGRRNGKTLEAVNRAYQQGWNDAIDAIIDNAPTIEERPKGKWIAREDMSYLDENKIIHEHFMCDRCGLIHDFIDGHTAQYNFCPNCGADMRGDV